jgi:hypothetical protein
MSKMNIQGVCVMPASGIRLLLSSVKDNGVKAHLTVLVRPTVFVISANASTMRGVYYESLTGKWHTLLGYLFDMKNFRRPVV